MPCEGLYVFTTERSLYQNLSSVLPPDPLLLLLLIRIPTIILRLLPALITSIITAIISITLVTISITSKPRSKDRDGINIQSANEWVRDFGPTKPSTSPSAISGRGADRLASRL